MREFLSSSVFFGLFLSIGAYELGMILKKKTGLAILNPLQLFLTHF